jgi:hypothetical protein
MMREWISITPIDMKIQLLNTMELHHIGSVIIDHASSSET